MPNRLNDKNIILGFNYHLPFGTPENIFEKIYTNRLKPFFQILGEFPDMRMALHLSGTLLYMIERGHGELFEVISDMIEREQIELLGGGFNEPMMPFILGPDRIGQIEFLNTYLRTHFGKKIRGCWIPDLAWDQSVASAVAESEHWYTFVDEKRFATASLPEAQYRMPCITEDKGKTIIVFPLSSSLCADFLKIGVDAAFDALLSRIGDEKFIRVVFPDLFGGNIDNETYIYNFFESVSKYKSIINFLLPEKAYKDSSVFQKVYFNCATGKEYLVNYPEAGLLYSKMARTKFFVERIKGDKARKIDAHKDLWKAQSFNVFSCGQEFFDDASSEYPDIHDPSLRNAVYSALLAAESAAHSGEGWGQSLVLNDFNFDGINEYLFQGELMNCYVRRRGAVLFELDYIPMLWNYQNTIALHSASCPRPYADTEASFFDIIAPPDYDAQAEEGSAFIRIAGAEMFEQKSTDREQQAATFYLHANGGVFGWVEIEKSCKLDGGTFLVHYEIKNSGTGNGEFKFITKINLSFLDDNEAALRMFAYNLYKSFLNHGGNAPIPNKKAFISNIEALDFQDLKKELIINISCDSKFDALVLPVSYKFKNALGEINDSYQWTKILFQKNCLLFPGESVQFTIKIGILQ